MSSIREHSVQSIVTSAALYPLIGENAVFFGLSVVFIDMDHVIDYIRQTGSWNIFGVFPYCKILEKNMKKNNFLVLNIFHTAEFFLFVGLLGLVHSVFFYILAGMLYHLALDLYHLKGSGIVFLRVFSIIEFLIRTRNRKYITSFSEILQQNSLDLTDVKRFNAWFGHWQKINPQLQKRFQQT